MKIDDLTFYLDGRMVKGITRMTLHVDPVLTRDVVVSVEVLEAPTGTFSVPTSSTLLCTLEAWNKTCVRLTSKGPEAEAGVNTEVNQAPVAAPTAPPMPDNSETYIKGKLDGDEPPAGGIHPQALLHTGPHSACVQ